MQNEVLNYEAESNALRIDWVDAINSIIVKSNMKHRNKSKMMSMRLECQRN